MTTRVKHVEMDITYRNMIEVVGQKKGTWTQKLRICYVAFIHFFILFHVLSITSCFVLFLPHFQHTYPACQQHTSQINSKYTKTHIRTKTLE